jgi:two-component system cell cycle sensor histidine kinase/response regulator CckA
MNLCTNAAHAMQEQGGMLEVNLDDVRIEQEQSAFGTDLKPGSYIRLTVSDTGHGIPPETMERIFEPYFTTKEEGQGTGLGLALVHSIIKTWGGGINVISEPDKGTTFYIFFPMMPTEDLAEPEMAAAMPQGKERILLVDDEPDIVAAAQIILEQLGYRVVGLANSREALETFRAAPDQFDLVITDQTMPQVTGVELTKEVLRLRPQLPVIICTGFSEVLTPEKAKALGVRELIMKPLIPQQLAEAVRRGLDAAKG